MMIGTLKTLLVVLFGLFIIFGSWFTDLDTEALGFILFVLSMLFLWGKWPGQMYIFCFFLAGLTMLFQGGVGIIFGLIFLAIGICFLFVALGKEPLFLRKLHSETLSSSSVYLDEKLDERDERMKFLWLFLLLIVGSIILAAMRAFNLNGFIPIAIVFTPFIFLANKIWNIKKKEPEDSQAPIDFTLVNKMLLIGCAGLIVAIYLIDKPQLDKQAAPPTQDEQGTAAPQQTSQTAITDHTAKAIDALQQASAWNNHGNAYYATKQYAKAIEAYQQGIRINPDYTEAWQGLGDTYLYGTKHYAKAIAAYQQAIRIEPDNVFIWLGLGEAYKLSGQTTKVMEVYTRIKTLHPGFAEAFFNENIR